MNETCINIYIYIYNKLLSHQHDGCNRPRYDAGQQEVQELKRCGLAEHGLEGLVEAELQRPLQAIANYCRA